MAIIDMHSHILPSIDDGSKNVEMSIEMLRVASLYKTDVQVATPHFYANKHSVESFLKKREQAKKKLLDAINKQEICDCPRLLVGAEIAFFKGISNADIISDLTIEGTNVVLVEMPFDVWTDKEILEIEHLIKKRGFKVIIAHIERYMSIHGNKSKIDKLLELPVTIQINADGFDGFLASRKLLKFVKDYDNIVLGSDCHNLEKRPPNLDKGREKIIKHLGNEVIERIDKNAELLLKTI